MASSSNTGSFPWASLAVLAAFVSSTLLVPHAFDALRPAEKERAQAPIEKELPIDARLWEDPFAALRRYEAEREERCSKLDKAAQQACAGPSAAAADAAVLPATMVRRWLQGSGADADKLGDATPGSGQTLLLAAMVPGNPFVGAEESRRRTRYAVLTGLMAAGFVPEDAEHLGLMTLDLRLLDSHLDTRRPDTDAAQRFNVPYELLRYEDVSALRPDARPPARRYRRVLLMWVDESELPQPRLDAMALLMTQLYGQWACAPHKGRLLKPQLAVIGPSSTDALRIALRDLDRAGNHPRSFTGFGIDAACLSKVEWPGLTAMNGLQQGYSFLADARFFNSASTAAPQYLPELKGQPIEKFLSEQFAEITGGSATKPVDYARTIATDSELLEVLVRELGLRIPAGKSNRVILVAERDSAYARALLHDTQVRLKALLPKLSLEPAYYFRGIDGVTTRDAAEGNETPAAPEKKAGDKSADDPARIEWPEARNQLDYLRRLAQSLKQSEADPTHGAIAAIGVVGFDVHDKLLVLQALHDGFADRIFFTTDMDARLLHPRVLPFTRNMVVASSLPLEIAPPQAKGVDLRTGTSPFRDVYQSATYLAARQAACLTEDCRKAEANATRELLDRPVVYEIGRTQPVALDLGHSTLKVGRADKGYGLVAGMLLALLILALLLWPSTPSLLELRARLVRRSKEARHEALRPISSFTAAMASAHLGVLIYMMCVMIAFLNQDAFKPFSLLWFMAVGLGLLALPPCLMFVTGLKKRRGRGMRVETYYGFVLLLAAGAVVLVWQQQGTHEIGGEPIAWFEGVSAFPSQLLHLLALAGIVFSLDLAWDRSLNTFSEDSAWLALPEPATCRTLRGCLPYVSVLGWVRPEVLSCDVGVLWQQYRQRGAPRPRAIRTVIAFLLTGLMIVGLWWALSVGGGEWSNSRLFEVPVRGAHHRSMVLTTLAIILALLPLSILAVADGTLLVYRFVTHLNEGRSVYPAACLHRFATALGDPATVALWLQPMACEPHQREPGNGADARHTLLDDWIDMQVVARRTEHVAPLVLGPFIVLGIVLLARSRIFDNWSMTPVIALTASAYLLVLLLLTALLKSAVEDTRRHALDHMAADLRWLKGQHGPQTELATPFEALMEEVRNTRAGAFAGMLEQPLLKAVLVPLGGVGGAQLLDYLSLAY